MPRKGKKSQEAKYSVSNLARGLDLIELLARHPAGLGVTEIAGELDIPKNAAFRVATYLWERGYLLRSDEEKAYLLSPRLLTLGYRAANRRSVIEKALPLMRRLRDEIRETVVICAMAGRQGVVLDHVPALHSFRFVVDAGMTFSLHASAPGKAILSALADDVLARVLDTLPLTRFNERTIATRDALEEELRAVRTRGYAVDRGEELVGVHCVAAPLVDVRGHPVAALNVTGPSNRFTADQLDAVGVRVRDCAREISRLLDVCEGNGHG